MCRLALERGWAAGWQIRFAMRLGLCIMLLPLPARSADRPRDPTEESNPVSSVPNIRILPTAQKDSVLAAVRIPASVIEEALNRDYKHEHCVDRTILGTRSRGYAECQGVVTCELIESSERAGLMCRISGTITSRTIGRNGPAIIRSRAVTHFQALKPVFLSGMQFSTQPTVVESQTQVHIEGVDSQAGGLRGRIVRRVARKRVRENHGQATHIVGELTRGELGEHIDAEFATRITALNEQMAGRLRVLKFLAMSDQQLYMRTSREFLEIVLASSDSPGEYPQATAGTKPESIELWLPVEDDVELDMSSLLSTAPGWLTAFFAATPRMSNLTPGDLKSGRRPGWLVLALP